MTTISRSPVNGQIESMDEIKSPNHYTWRGRECEEIIGDITQGTEGKEAYYLGAVVKYLYRYPKKGTPLKDLPMSSSTERLPSTLRHNFTSKPAMRSR